MINSRNNYSKNDRKVKVEYFITGFLFCLLFITLIRKPDPSGDGFLQLSSSISPDPPVRNPQAGLPLYFSLNQGRPTRHRQDGPDDKKMHEAFFNARGGPSAAQEGPPVYSRHTIHGLGGLEGSLDGPPTFDWLDGLIDNIHQVESSGRLNPPDGDNGRAVGPLQIHKCVVKDVNLFYNTDFTHEDCRDIEKARIIARLYMTMWMNAYREELASRIWNGGPDGWREKCTEGYWEKIQGVE